MQKSLTLMDLVRSAHNQVAEDKVARLVSSAFLTGVVRFKRPTQAKRAIRRYYSSI